MSASVSISVSAVGGAIATVAAGIIHRVYPDFLNTEIQGALQTIFVSTVVGLSYLARIAINVIMRKYGLAQEGTGNGEKAPSP